MITPARPSPQDPTLDIGGGDSSADSSADGGCSLEECAAYRVALIEGSGPGLSSENESVLRDRLRSAALVLTAGFGLFLLKQALLIDWADGRQQFFLAFLAVVTQCLGLSSVKLCRRCVKTLRFLRLAEFVTFGLPAIFFLSLQAANLIYEFPEGHTRYVVSPPTPWLMLIFTYALFIPNSWRRAAVVTGLMALAPTSLFTGAWFAIPVVHEAIPVSELIGIGLGIGVAAMSAVFGVYTISQLRREAFEARQFGQYRLKTLLGSGGMGEVYLAEHQLLKRPCAIKVIRPSKAHDPHVLARFQREVRATAKLTHWNTVEIFDYGSTDDGTFYYVMEYLPGLSLAELVERHGPLPAERAIHLLEQTCDALAEAHAAGLVHRDIKPGNIFAAQRGGVYDVAKLLDFGLAKPIVPLENSQLTIAGAITGSPLFMSPEQAAGDREPDGRSDIYSLGAVAYFLLTGRPPFESDSPLKVLVAHMRDEASPPSQLRPDLPADLEAVVLRCLAKDPDDRYADAAALALALADCESAGHWTRDEARRWWEGIGGCRDIRQAEPIGAR